MKKIYFDNAATTKVDNQVFEKLLPYLKDDYGNSSSVHSFGQKTVEAVDNSREIIAKHLNCDSKEIIFTSGATEGNNLAVWGVLNKLNLKDKLHFITTSIEHPSVLQVYKKLEKLGHEVTFLNVNEEGVISINQLKNEIKNNTVMVSVMFVNNEVGSMQPVAEVGKLVKEERSNRGNDLPIYFHIDAVQAMNYFAVDVQEIGCDFLSFSGHKIHAPKGIGALYIRKGVSLEKMIFGGTHEYGIRPGTLNVPGIVGLGEAVALLAKDQDENYKKLYELRNYLVENLKQISEIRINGGKDSQAPHILNVSFLKAEGESILMLLDMEGIAISTGSACSSGALEPSHVLISMGVPVEWTHGSIRISLSKYNTKDEVDEFVKKIKPIIEKLREMAPDIK